MFYLFRYKDQRAFSSSKTFNFSMENLIQWLVPSAIIEVLITQVYHKVDKAWIGTWLPAKIVQVLSAPTEQEEEEEGEEEIRAVSFFWKFF